MYGPAHVRLPVRSAAVLMWRSAARSYIITLRIIIADEDPSGSVFVYAGRQGVFNECLSCLEIVCYDEYILMGQPEFLISTLHISVYIFDDG